MTARSGEIISLRRHGFHRALSAAFVLGMALSAVVCVYLAKVEARETRSALASARVELLQLKAQKCPMPRDANERIMKWLNSDGDVGCQSFWMGEAVLSK